MYKKYVTTSKRIGSTESLAYFYLAATKKIPENLFCTLV